MKRSAKQISRSLRGFVCFVGFFVTSSALSQVPRFDLIGNSGPSGAMRATDINESGSIVVGTFASGGVWRWERGVGLSVMPAFAQGYCFVSGDVFVSADGTRVVGSAGGPQCIPIGPRKMFRWVVGSVPQFAFGTDSTITHVVAGCSATGAAGGTWTQFGYDSMFSTSYGVVQLAAYDTAEPGCEPDDWIYSHGYGVTPDGYVLGLMWDCDVMRPGAVWRGGTDVTRLTTEPIAGSWGATVLISGTHRWTAQTGWQPLSFASGSTATDISWDGRVIAANTPDGATSRATYSLNNGVPFDVRTSLINGGNMQVGGVQLRSVAAISGDGRWITGTAALSNGAFQAFVAELPTQCDSIDFNNDTSLFDPQDIEAFLLAYSEGGCVPATATCNDIDFNNDGVVFDPCDIDSFLTMYSEGPCTVCGN
ncbi:MAG: hypothetical protein U0640_04555 [Phycisphaerales bacterium]